MSHDATSSDLWDGIAARYDDLGPDQSLADPRIRQHWQQLYAGVLPDHPCAILDAGCGTGSLGIALAETGHDVVGIDFAPKMVKQATAKAVRFDVSARFEVQDAAAPDFPPQSFDAVICRQVLWALPDRQAALENWARMLKPQGVMLLIEGLFASGNGMAESEIVALLPGSVEHIATRDLSTDALLWGATLKDQRYLLIARSRHEKGRA